MKDLLAAVTLVALSVPTISTPAVAQRHSTRDYRWQGDNNRN